MVAKATEFYLETGVNGGQEGGKGSGGSGVGGV